MNFKYFKKALLFALVAGFVLSVLMMWWASVIPGASAFTRADIVWNIIWMFASYLFNTIIDGKSFKS